MMGKGIIWLTEDDMKKFSRGVVLPEEYEFADNSPWYDNTRACWGIVIAGPDITVVSPMETLPDLAILRGFQSLIVQPYKEGWVIYTSKETDSD